MGHHEDRDDEPGDLPAIEEIPGGLDEISDTLDEISEAEERGDTLGQYVALQRLRGHLRSRAPISSDAPLRPEERRQLTRLTGRWRAQQDAAQVVEIEVEDLERGIILIASEKAAPRRLKVYEISGRRLRAQAFDDYGHVEYRLLSQHDDGLDDDHDDGGDPNVVTFLREH